MENLTKCGIILKKIIDRRTLMVYYKYKLVRFTGVPLNDLVECGDFIKTNSGLKQTNVPQGWARNSGETGRKAGFY